MKKCPNCNKTYTDEALNFCLDDGTVLELLSDAKTNQHLSNPTEHQTEILSSEQVSTAVTEPQITPSPTNEIEQVEQENRSKKCLKFN